ncbi:VENN motif pre-toxin domain-containing protein, partial [Chelonobacter oris]|uniref:VENN motif pre-toxin domain-containing protein n=1 Tax=Chelonobacter oris TaxID=505317 RepID=UPI00244CCE13
MAEQLYGKAPQDLSAEEKETSSSLSQVVGALSAAAVANNGTDAYRGAETAKSAVENNLLGAEDSEALLILSNKFNEKKVLLTNEQQIAEYLLSKDSEINRLIELNQINPEALTDPQKAYLNHELSLIAKSYNIPINTLYNWDFSKASIGRDDTTLRDYLKKNNIYAGSFDNRVAQGVRDGMALYPGISGVSMLAGAMPKTAALAQKYPLLTDITATAVVNTG